MVLTPIGNPPNSMDDCIEGIEEPLYGFRANVILLKDFPCILGVTCNSPSISGMYLVSTGWLILKTNNF